MSDLPDTDILTERLISIVEADRRQVALSVNSAMMQAYWTIGREIVETEQGGEERASYGDAVVKRVAGRLNARVAYQSKGTHDTSILTVMDIMKRMREAA